MPVFPRFLSNSLADDVRPLLRLLDDPSFYQPTGETGSRSIRAFSPNFDVHETDKEYVLEGELPGLNDKSNVSIEFTDHNTLLIRGKIERSYQSGTPPDQQQAHMKGAHESEKKTHKPTVEEEGENKETQVTKTDDQNKQVGQPTTKYWVSERSVGSFQRSFSFPGEVDQDNVTAKLKDGILTVKVPKKQHKPAKRIMIE